MVNGKSSLESQKFKVQTMCPSAAQQDAPLSGYKERVRSELRRLMLKEGLYPGHPSIVGCTALLDKSTAHAELGSIVAQQSEQMSESQIRELRVQCFKGPDLFYSVPCKPASSINDT